MLPTFSLRLACGLIGSLLLLAGAQVNPRFYRTHFLTALGLTALAAIFLWDVRDPWLFFALGGALGLALLSSIVWMLDSAPGGRLLIVLTLAALVLALGRTTWNLEPEAPRIEEAAAPLGWRLADDYTSAALLGTAVTSMLIGHIYLIAPAMSLSPLLRLLKALFVCTLLRIAVSLLGLWYWTGEPGLVNVETVLWLVPRWGVGLALPLVLGCMAWEAAKIRSTQSATGILYVVVICCFLGELTSQLLLARTSVPL